jgi:hypothetical protein
MAVLDWDHNAYYQRLPLRQLPKPCRRVLDADCGAGARFTLDPDHQPVEDIGLTCGVENVRIQFQPGPREDGS